VIMRSPSRSYDLQFKNITQRLSGRKKPRRSTWSLVALGK